MILKFDHHYEHEDGCATACTICIYLEFRQKSCLTPNPIKEGVLVLSIENPMMVQSRVTRLEFDGVNPTRRVYQVLEFFKVNQVSDTQKIPFASYHMEKESIAMVPMVWEES